MNAANFKGETVMFFDLPPLIPRDDLFGNPDKASPELSPDGKYLAYLAPDEGVLNVWVRTVGQEDDRAVTRDRKRGIRMFFWTYDGRRLGYIQDLDGDENWHIWSVDLETGVIRDMTPFQGAQAQLVGVDHRFPNEILVSLNVRDERLHDVYRVDLTTGAVVPDIQNPGDVVGWLADSTFRVRGAVAATPDGGFQLRVRQPSPPAPLPSEREGAGGEGWRPLVTWGPEEEGHPYTFTEDGRSLYVGSSLGTDTQELRVVDAATGAETTLASNPEVDLGDLVFHPIERRAQAVGFAKHRMEWTILDPAIAADFETLRGAQPGEFHVASRDMADRTWIVLYVRDTAPAAYYTYDRAAKKLDFLFTTRPALEKFTLAEMRPVEIKSRDGLNLVCYLTLPPGMEEEDETRRHGDAGTEETTDNPKSKIQNPKLNLPLVLNVHGGPWGRDMWGYDPEAQWLANRGYACLQVNFRGSAGFGKKFLHAGDREWGAKMHDDLIDAVNWAVAEGIADPKRIAIYGGSYGGYAALAGAAFTPDVFCCSVDVVGPSSLRTLINSIPPYWEPLRKMFTVRVGDPETEPEFLDSRSPLYKADQIQCPMLIAQGANDPRVKQAESEQIVAALRERGKPVEYMLFEDEGHGFARPENRLKFYAAAEKFLATYLGGRAEA
jgi:dipeptidyl aminopeptidase/acylaminoacyl peptidase